MPVTVLFTLAVVVLVLLLLVTTSLGADAVLLGGLVLLLLGGVVDARTAVGGFANEGMLTVAALFVVAAGVRQTGAVSRLCAMLLGRSEARMAVMGRLTLPVAMLSGFLNNTPIVAAMVPGILEWSRRHDQPASRYLIPLSYATILGGMVTVIGTSTNLVVTGLVQRSLADHPGLRAIGMFDITPIGLPLALVGCAMLVVLGSFLLPDRRPPVSPEDDPRRYTCELLVLVDSPMVGATIEDAGLRHLPNAFLAELYREGEVLAAEPTTRLHAGDRLVFVGPREAMVDLARIPGLAPAAEARFDRAVQGGDRVLVEAVVAPQNPLVGRSIRDGEFRSTYQAVVVAVARDGRHVQGRIGDIVLQRGDVLLLETHPSWAASRRDSRDFHLVSEVEDSASFRHHKAPIALGAMVLMVAVAATGLLSMFEASVGAAAVMVLTGCLSGEEARRSVELPVLVAIAAALGIGEGIRASGADQHLATAVVSVAGDSPWVGLLAIYVGTAILTELVTNNAAAALMFPFALSLGERLGVSPMPFVVAVMFAASASFATPIGYQTNLMVYGPGGYRFTDFLRVGLPMQALAMAVSCALVPWVFPF
ncbi:MAG: SLC13 family permease [Alphaproteobacteria bacterium]|nr:SLC13 family permease [Alphaproteobacteria bacterium]MCB9698173.1 SLC13 family permease [Alphaproteobacteria bacterium]